MLPLIAEREVLDHLRESRPGGNQTITVELRSLAALGRFEEMGARILANTERGWGPSVMFEEIRAHGYAAEASDLLDQTLEWFESRTPNRKPGSRQSYLYGSLLHRAGRSDEAKAVFEDMLAVPNNFHPLVARELAFVYASQGHRDQALKVVATWSPNANDNPVFLAAVEAVLGNRERAMELLRENGPAPGLGGMHGLAMLYEFSSLVGYPPFEEFTRPTG